MNNCMEGFLCEECESCEFWRDGTDGEYGCMTSFPIEHCEGFMREFTAWEQSLKEGESDL